MAEFGSGLESLDVLLYRLALGLRHADAQDLSTDRVFYETAAVSRVRQVVHAEADERTRLLFESRLRLALHLAPRSAIKYNRRSVVPRYRLIRDHLTAAFGFSGEGVEELARALASVLDNWEEERSGVTQHRQSLMKLSDNRCSHCRARLGDASNRSVQERDPYKPYFEDVAALLSPEVDHIEAVSGLGANNIENLQILCRLCNRGKGDGLGLDTRLEARYAGMSVSDIDTRHRAALLYYVLERDRRKCAVCATGVAELTVRPVIDAGAVVRSNLRTLCVNCAYGADPARSAR